MVLADAVRKLASWVTTAIDKMANADPTDTEQNIRWLRGFRLQASVAPPSQHGEMALMLSTRKNVGASSVSARN
jgi:hypothetical protein